MFQRKARKKRQQEAAAGGQAPEGTDGSSPASSAPAATAGPDGRASGLQIVPAPSLAALRAYPIPQPNPCIDLPLGGTERTVPLSFDTAPGASPLCEALGPDLVSHYPDPSALEGLLAHRLEVAPEHVLVTAGADEALDRACRAVLAPGRRVVLPTPTFEMLSHYAKLAGAEVTTVPWPGGALPVQAMLQAAHASDDGVATAAVGIVTPNNPTGATATVAEIQALAQALPQALIVVDMAYGEFADVELGDALAQLPNVVMVRTLSKAWGLPGLRVGYAVGHPTVIGWMRAAGGPYAVSRPSLALAEERLRSGDADTLGYAGTVKEERRRLTDQLRTLGAQPAPSQANFVWCSFTDAAWARDGLAGVGVGVRSFAAHPQHLRITCPGNEAAFGRLTAALDATLAPEALLFDLDGVLADVSKSYRAAILKTAAHFGVTISGSEVMEAKSAGHANNDWELTHRLLQRHGLTDVTLEAVTEHFEGLYQGTADGAAPGLHAQESLLVSAAWVGKLARRRPLAIVTGRPRRDAERFLQQHGILEHFATLVCMEDGPLKPDPAPARRALQELGVKHAWMVGDTPDDVRAARHAGVVPLGVVAPGDVMAPTAAALMRAGAARVLRDLATELEGLLDATA